MEGVRFGFMSRSAGDNFTLIPLQQGVFDVQRGENVHDGPC